MIQKALDVGKFHTYAALEIVAWIERITRNRRASLLLCPGIEMNISHHYLSKRGQSFGVSNIFTWIWGF